MPVFQSITWRIVGGGKNSRRWNQMKADVYGIPCTTLTNEEAGATGSADAGGGGSRQIYEPRRGGFSAHYRERNFPAANRIYRQYRVHFHNYKKLYGATKEIVRVKNNVSYFKTNPGNEKSGRGSGKFQFSQSGLH